MNVSRYGFRLFAVTLHEGRRRAPLDYHNVPGGPYPAQAENAIKPHLEENISFIRTVETQPGSGVTRPEGALLRFTEVEQDTESLKMWFRAGSVDEGLVIDPDGVADDLNIDGRVNTRSSRALLLLPPASGTVAVLGVEVRGRGCPHDKLRKSINKLLDGTLRLNLVDGLADSRAIAEFIRNGMITELNLVKLGTADDGERTRKDIDLHVNVRGRAQLSESLREKALTWVGRKVSYDQSELAAIAAEVRDEALEQRVSINFDAAELYVTGSSGRSRRIRPQDELTEFVYDLGDYWVQDSAFFPEVKKAARDILLSYGSVPVSGAPQMTED